MNIPKINIGDRVELKKPHPCGSHTFTVTRVGTDIKIVCAGCGHEVMIPREKLERAIKKIIPVEAKDEV